ncbi:DUF3043 domain-containing protein [Actinotalea sp. Marseille-Q4924]|uniref:DUF3043 domain-containing protein n=1 Tax=Actinotalea sp. Marseille-Q4924 TaxID=2866571 RepID=UPI001CE43EAB|nr:DUF3043 domain-containing protein [Actinotalea sp. Marseille-Q4924]
MPFRDRKKDSPVDAVTAAPADPSAAPPLGGKGRPTPRRREAEAARRRPLVPEDRKAAAKSQRAALRQQRDREYQAMLSGDEANLPARDRGKVRRYVRDYVDARWNLGEFFLPFSLVMVFAILVTGNDPAAGLITLAVLYLVVLITVVDGFILSRILKRRIAARFGEVPRGTMMYGVVRAFQIRRSRLPRPQVKRGQYPA